MWRFLILVASIATADGFASIGSGPLQLLQNPSMYDNSEAALSDEAVANHVQLPSGTAPEAELSVPDVVAEPVTPPPPPPAPFNGVFCAGIACDIQRAAAAKLSGLPKLHNTSAFSAVPAVPEGVEPFLCRGLGCPAGHADPPPGKKENVFTAACGTLLAFGTAAPPPGSDSSQTFELLCKQRLKPSEVGFCSDYADVFKAAEAAFTKTVCSATFQFLHDAKQAEVDLHLFDAALFSSGQPPHQLLPGSQDGVMPPIEVPGGVFEQCQSTIQTATGTQLHAGAAVGRSASDVVRLLRDWCEKAERLEWTSTRCKGMEMLAAFALREDFSETSLLSAQQACHKLFLAVGSIHRVAKLVQGGWPYQMYPPPLSLGPRLPLPTDPEMVALVKESRRDATVAANAVEHEKEVAKQAEAAKQALGTVAAGGLDIGDAGGAAPSVPELPSILNFHAAGRGSLRASRLSRLRKLARAAPTQ